MSRHRREGLFQACFRLCGLARDICRAGIEGYGPYSQLKDVVIEAVYQWGVVNIVREPEGGMRLARRETVASPFGSRREAALYRQSLERDGKPQTTTVIFPPLLDAILRTACEDERGRELYASNSAVINIAVIQWGLTHLELSYEDGAWDLARPLALRQAFDLAPHDIPIRTAAAHPDAITAPERVFPPVSKYDADTRGYVSVPFYKPNADAGYLDAVASGKRAPDAVRSEEASAAEEAEVRARILEAFDAMDFD